MEENSQYQGSQAFNQLLVADEQVNTGTGSLALSFPLVRLPGIHADIGLCINLIYGYGSGGVFGLPRNWSINLPFVIPSKTLSWAGNCYILDPEWVAEDGYRSGLKYWNAHGTLFQHIISPQCLPSGCPGKFNFSLKDKEGQLHLFDATGKLLETVDRFGNFISYSYVDPLSGPVGNRLKEIVDSFGQSVTFDYDIGNKIVITAPNDGKTTIIFTTEGIVRLLDCENNVTSFQYEPYGSGQVLVEALYPTGLHSYWRYTDIHYREKNGSVGRIPAVSDFYHKDESRSGALLEHTQYLYGQNTGNNTYTGYTIGCTLSDNSDALMDKADPMFRYDVVTIKCDDKGEWLMATTAYFNYLHALLYTEFHQVVAPKRLSQGRRIANTYPPSTLNLARTCNATSPLTIEYSEWSTDNNTYVPTHRETRAYDHFGNITSTASYNTDEKQPRLVVTSIYREVDWGGEMLETSLTHDQVTGGTFRRQVELTDNQRNIRSIKTSASTDGSDTWLPWKDQQFEYDEHGREIEASLQWAKDAPIASRGPSRTATRHNYFYDKESHILAVVRIDDKGAESTMRYDMRFPQPLLLSSEDALGERVSYQYDDIGRTIASVDPVGNRTQYVYQLAQKDGVNSATVVHPSGYRWQYLLDAVGRRFKTLDSGNEITGSESCTRVVEQVFYDCAGNISRRVNQQQQVQTFGYDALRRPTMHNDHLGNQTRSDYSVFSVTTSLNDMVRSVVVYDGLGNTLRQITFALQAPNSSSEQLVVESTFDGHGRPLTLCKSHTPAGSSHADTLSRASFLYNPVGKVRQITLEGYDSDPVSVETNHNYDLLSNVTQTQRRVTYGDGRSFAHHSDSKTYDSLGQLVSVENALGLSKHYSYDLVGNLTAKTRFNGSTVRFSYTPDRLTQTIMYGGTVETYAYDSQRQLTGIDRDNRSIRYKYDPDGTLRAVCYDNDLQQTYDYDDSGRLTVQTDPSTSQTHYTYNPEGQIATQKYRDEELHYHYGCVNGREGVLTGLELLGQRHIQQEFGYDSFDAPNATRITDSTSGALLLDTQQAFDANRRLIQLSCKTSHRTWQQRFSYDGLNQLIEENTVQNNSAVQVLFTYDGNGNVLKKSTRRDGAQQVDQSFTYNAIDQLVGDGIEYDKLGRLRASNGSQYTYDDCDRLITATTTKGTVGFTYHADGMLASRSGTSSDRRFFYDNGIANVMQSSDGAFTNVLHGPTGPLALCRDSDPTTYLLSAFGSVVASFNERSESHYLYAGYGEQYQIQTDTGLSPFRWKNEFYDEGSELVYLRARFYDPASMRFLTADSYPVANKYNFGFGDPINQFDPTGHYSTTGIVLDSAAIGFGIGGAIAAPFTGGSSLAVSAAVVSGLLGAASGAVGLINDVSRNGNKAAADVSVVLGVAGLACDVASAAISIKAMRAAAQARVPVVATVSTKMDETVNSVRTTLGSGIAYVGEDHENPVAAELFERVIGDVKGVSLELPSNTNVYSLGNDVPPHYKEIVQIANEHNLPVVFHDMSPTRGLWKGMQGRNEFARDVIKGFIAEKMGNDPRGLFVLGGSDHFENGLKNGNSNAIVSSNRSYSSLQSLVGLTQFKFFDISEFQ